MNCLDIGNMALNCPPAKKLIIDNRVSIHDYSISKEDQNFEHHTSIITTLIFSIPFDNLGILFEDWDKINKRYFDRELYLSYLKRRKRNKKKFKEFYCRAQGMSFPDFNLAKNTPTPAHPQNTIKGRILKTSEGLFVIENHEIEYTFNGKSNIHFYATLRLPQI